MADVYGILGQAAPPPGVTATVYTVPVGKRGTIRVIVANRGADDTFRVAVSPLGAGLIDAHYITYGQLLEANEAITSAPFEVGATDIVRVYSTNGTISFTVSGLEDDNP